MNAKIFEIKRFAVHDGDGIRTTVFFKGCPLNCAWCHNPEGIGFAPELAYYEEKCISCGECVVACLNEAHFIENNLHKFNRQKCMTCGICEDVCLGNSLIFYGKEIAIDELLMTLLEDKEFYETSGGGVTLSGGECLMQLDFCKELLKKLKEMGIHTAVDTCGFVKKDALDAVMPYTDVFLYDLKAYDEDVHIKCTGQSNKTIIDNLKYIDDMGADIEIRIPYVPGYNDDQIPKLAVFISELRNVSKVRVLPYHNFARGKYSSLDMKNTLLDVLPSDEEMEIARDNLKKYCSCCVL